MKIKKPDATFLEKAQKLSKAESERLLSRMGGKLRRKQDKDKVTEIEAIAIQLEVEAEKLKEWRERMAAIKQQEQGKK